jgi:pimeloyl-ACP methyl ester carboxylesterase
MTLQLQPRVDGRQDARAETLFFIQGWPDDASLWDGAVAKLGGRYRCVRVNLPNYADAPSARWGYSTDQIVEALAQCIRTASPGAPVTLIIHDWGAYWGYILHHRHPELVKRVVGLDIAPHYKPGPAAVLGIIAYQGWLASAFFLGGPLGDWMTRSLATTIGAPGRPEAMHSAQNYPYRNVWQDLFSGRAERSTRGYWPKLPLLFVYGTKKPFPFHSQNWLDHVRSVGGEVVALDAGHWLQRHPEFEELLARWLQATDAPPPN